MPLVLSVLLLCEEPDIKEGPLDTIQAVGERQAALDRNQSSASGAPEPAGKPVRPSSWGRLLWIWLARLGFLGYMVVAIARFYASLPDAYAHLTRVCPQLNCPDTLLSTPDAADLQSFGFTVQSFAAYHVVLVAVMGSVFFLVAAVICWRRSDDWTALLSAATLVALGATFPGATDAILILRPGGRFPEGFYSPLGGIVFMVFFYALFPDGRFVPGWTRYTSFAWAAFVLYSSFFPTTLLSLKSWYGGRETPIMLAWLAVGVGCQVYRYWRVSGPMQRPQTKWIVFGTLVGYSAAAGYLLLGDLFPDLGDTGRDMLIYSMIGGGVRALCILLIPVFMGFAILRYRLWNIDVLINRTLVYVPLTAILAGIYAATVVLLQRLFITLTGATSDAIIVISTLVLTATFTPIKNALQSFVDKRFKEVNEPAGKLRALDTQIESVIDVLDSERISRKALDVIVSAYAAQGGAVYLARDGRTECLYTTKGWDDAAAISFELKIGHEHIGRLSLGKRHTGQEYSDQDRDHIQGTVDLLVQSIALSRATTEMKNGT